MSNFRNKMNKTIQISSDMLCNILKKLPVKDLLRFKCVSKGWFSLIKDPYFIKLHLKEITKMNISTNIVIKDANSGKLFCADFDFVNLKNPRELNHPFTRRLSECEEGNSSDDYAEHFSIDQFSDIRYKGVVDYTEVMGSCNGLLFLVNETYRTNTIVLWNMSTGDYKVLPDLPVVVDHKGSRRPGQPTVVPVSRGRTFYGFGYDPVTDDYKVVRIVQGMGISEVKVYSLKANAWRCSQVEEFLNNCFIRLFPFSCFYPIKRGGTFFRGALHWVVGKRSEFGDLVIALDIGSEKYHEIELLDCMKTMNMRGDMDLGALRGCLCLFSSGSSIFNEGAFGSYDELWVMKDYGVKESWTLLFRVSENMYGIPSFLFPLAYSKNYERILLGFYWYHINGDEVMDPIPSDIISLRQQLADPDYDKFVRIPQLETIRPFFTEICVGSLLQL